VCGRDATDRVAGVSPRGGGGGEGVLLLVPARGGGRAEKVTGPAVADAANRGDTGPAAAIPLGHAHRKIIDERLAEHDDNPDDVISRDEVLAEARRG
jgi:hypothetical protein